MTGTRHTAHEEQRERRALERYGLLPYRIEHAVGTDLQFKVEMLAPNGRVIEEIQSDSNVNGVLGSIQDQIEDCIAYDGVNAHDWTFRVTMEPREEESRARGES